MGTPLAFPFARVVLATLDLRRLLVVGAFYTSHLGLQGVRLLAGVTRREAIEVPAASLGVFLIAVFALADRNLRAEFRAWLLAALAAGALG